MFDALHLTARTLVPASAAERTERYVCPNPACGMPVILKAGTQVAPYFAHYDAAPKCPLYAPWDIDVWNGRDTDAARRLQILHNGSCAILTHDWVERIQVGVYGSADPLNCTPEIQLREYEPSKAERMVFVPDLSGTRLWSMESAFCGETYYAVSRESDAPPIAAHKVGTVCDSWIVSEFTLPEEPPPVLASWLKEARIHLRPRRFTWKPGCAGELSAADHLHVRLGSKDERVGSVSLSGAALILSIKGDSWEVTTADLASGVLITVTSRTLYPIPHETKWTIHQGVPQCATATFGTRMVGATKVAAGWSNWRLRINLAQR